MSTSGVAEVRLFRFLNVALLIHFVVINNDVYQGMQPEEECKIKIVTRS